MSNVVATGLHGSGPADGDDERAADALAWVARELYFERLLRAWGAIDCPDSIPAAGPVAVQSQ